MFWESFNEMPMIQKMGLLTPIDEAVAPIKDRFITGSQQYVTFDGKVYGMIYKNDAMGFFYNKKLLKQVGYDELPIDWDQFIDCVKKLRAAGITPIAHGATDTWSIWAYNLFFFRYGWRDLEGKFMNGEIKWADTEGLMKPLERIYELSEAGAFPENVTSQGNDYASNMFLGGEAAMYNVGTWALGNMIDSAIADDIGFSWGPFFPDGIADQKIALKEFSNAYWFGPNAFKGEEKKKIMIDAIQHYYSEQFTNEIMVEKLGLLPAVTYTGTGEKVSPLFNLMLSYIGDDYSADMQLAVRNEPSFQEPIWNAITSMITRFMTPEEAAETMDEWYQTK
jgi:raffinose/stachyose/melibiose transport system substrate-binding protein